MASVLDWVKNATLRVLDPGREERLDLIARHIEKALAAERKQFDLDRTISEIGVLPEDIKPAVERTYVRFLHRAWKDHAISDSERTALAFVAKSLRMDARTIARVEEQAGHGVFQAALSQAISDGALDESEAQQLERIAANMGRTTRDLMTGAFCASGEGFLRSLFLSAGERGLSEREWQRVVTTAQRLGIDEPTLREIILPHVERLIEHSLAEAKADGLLSRQEEAALTWLLETLSPRDVFAAYVRQELVQLRQITDITEGKLPSLSHASIARRAGEIVHAEHPCVYREVRQLKSGERITDHHGIGVVTDNRFAYNSSTRTHDLNHRKVVEIIPHRHGFDVRASGRGGGIYSFGGDVQLVTLIYESAVRKANQTLVARQEGLPSRHIPRDVRQRVWQRYGGRCAECGADQYLEFDHIVPVAKGGSNTDQNVQLLCRRCNGRKSDAI